MNATTRAALTRTLGDYLLRGLPVRRLASLAGLLIRAGHFPEEKHGKDLATRLIRERKPDGGWVDVEDTAWCAFVLQHLGYIEEAKAGVKWISQERSGKAWGYCRRDGACIPISAAVCWLHPTLADSDALLWLCNTWETDLRSPFQLSYKAAWYLLAHDADNLVHSQLCHKTVSWLLEDQRSDGGWGPWRDHPAATDFFTSGIVLTALGRWDSYIPGDPQVRRVVELGQQWIDRHRMDNGFFPTHYIEQGSAWLALGETAISNILQS